MVKRLEKKRNKKTVRQKRHTHTERVRADREREILRDRKRNKETKRETQRERGRQKEKTDKKTERGDTDFDRPCKVKTG